MSGGCNNSTYCSLTKIEVKQRFGCTPIKRCVSCNQRSECTEGEAEKYQQYKRMQKRELRERYKCDIVGGLCQLKKCGKYDVCNKAAKKNYLAWKNAYKQNRKEELERLSKGGI